MFLLTNTSSAPTPRIFDTLVSGETTGLEVPRDLIAGIGAGTGAMQLVINVHTDSHGNIEWNLLTSRLEDMEGLSYRRRAIKGGIPAVECVGKGIYCDARVRNSERTR
ncbi:unnamed protein product, partial [Iphiclides podalirius]